MIERLRLHHLVANCTSPERGNSTNGSNSNEKIDRSVYIAKTALKSSPTKVAQAKKKRPKTVAKPKTGKSTTSEGRSPITRICCALAELQAIRMLHPPRDMVALMAGYDGESPGFKKALGGAKKSGHIFDGKDKTLELTTLGRGSVPEVKPPKNNQEMHTKLNQILLKKKAPKKVSIVLGLLADGNAHAIADIAEATEYDDPNSAGFKKFIGIIGAMKGFFVRVYARCEGASFQRLKSG